MIDLGEPRDEIELAPRPWSPSPPRRRAVGAVALLAVLLAVSGAATPVRSGLVTASIQATAADEYMVDGDALFIMRPSQGVLRAGLRTITRYRLPKAAEPEWEARIYADGQVRGASTVDGMVLAIVVGSSDMQTVAIRPDTGQEVWRRAGWYHRTAAGRGLLQNHNPTGQAQEHFSIDLATGDVRWSRAFPPDDPVFVDGDRLLHWTASGTVEVYDADTGDLLVTGRVPLGREDLGPRVAGGLLLVSEEVDSRSTIVAYGRERLDRRWQADIDVSREFVHGDCGPGICVGALGPGGGLRLLDPATGRVRWSAPGWEYASPAGRYLLAYGPSGPTTPRVALVDPADGRVVRDLGEWNFSAPDKDGRMLGTQEKDGRALVGRLDPTTAKVEVLGVLDRAFLCQAAPVAVACRHADGSIGVWYPRRRL